MTISYKKLWKLLIDRDLLKRDVCKMANISGASMAKLGKGQNVYTDILLRICEALDVNISEIMEIIPSEDQFHMEENDMIIIKEVRL